MKIIINKYKILFVINAIMVMVLTNCSVYELITFRHVETNHLRYKEREKLVKLSHELIKQKEYIVSDTIIFPAFKATVKKIARDSYFFDIFGISQNNNVIVIRKIDFVSPNGTKVEIFKGKKELLLKTKKYFNKGFVLIEKMDAKKLEKIAGKDDYFYMTLKIEGYPELKYKIEKIIEKY